MSGKPFQAPGFPIALSHLSDMAGFPSESAVVNIRNGQSALWGHSWGPPIAGEFKLL